MSVIAGLEILNLHAQGGMAEVYRARGQGADGTVYHYAVKRILPEYTRDAEVKRMFIEESRVAACLVHPNVVRVYDLATTDTDELYIVMEFLEGKDLSEGIEDLEKKGQSLPIWFSIQMARDVLNALHYVTTQATDKNGRTLGLIHRDISPHNIFVCFDGQVKLTDFGVAKVQESNIKTQVGITKGKLGYMSPEQLMGSPLDFRSDLYNVGILLFESITGHALFQGASTAEFLQAMVRGIVPPISPSLQVPPELDALIRRALDRDRNKRPASALEFERELAQIAERYNLTASSAHIAHQMREMYGKPPPPPPGRPPTAPQRLKSMLLNMDTLQPQAPQAPAQPHYQAPQPQYQAPQPSKPQYQAPQPQYQPPQPQYQPPQPQYQPPQQSGYQSPYARPKTLPGAKLNVDEVDDGATQVRAMEHDEPALITAPVPAPQPSNRSNVGVPKSNRVASRAVQLPSEPSSPHVSAPLPQQVIASPRISAPINVSGNPATNDFETGDFETGTIEFQQPPPTNPNRATVTVARGNARPIEAVPSVPRPNVPLPEPAWQPTPTGVEESPERTRIEPAPTRPPAHASDLPPPPSTNAANVRPPTVTVGSNNVGVRGKRVVPLDDPKG